MRTIVEILMMNFSFRVTDGSNHLTKIDKPKMEVGADKNHCTETRFAEFELRIVNSVKACIESTLEKSSTNTTVAFSGLFRCVICFDSTKFVLCMPILWTLREVFFVLIKSRQMSAVQKKVQFNIHCLYRILKKIGRYSTNKKKCVKTSV